MTFTTSKSSHYDIDERLTVDPPMAMQGPLQLAPVKMKRKDSAQSSPVRLERPRSIFSEYWKTDAQLSQLPPSASLISIEEDNQHSPQRRRIIHKRFAYNYDRNPFQFFGIEEDESRISSTDDSEDSDSLNSYEGILQRREIGVSENKPRRSNTCPSLSSGMEGMVVDRSQKMSQSDTALFVKTSSSPLRRLSCLRKSRFSFDTDGNDGNTMLLNKGERKGERRPSVSFEAKIMVHLFPPTVEEWAPSGWSNWFGGWQ